MNLTANIQHYGQFTLPQKLYKKKHAYLFFLVSVFTLLAYGSVNWLLGALKKKKKKKNIYISIYIYIIFFFFNVYTNNIKFLNKVLSLFLQYSSVHVPE